MQIDNISQNIIPTSILPFIFNTRGAGLISNNIDEMQVRKLESDLFVIKSTNVFHAAHIFVLFFVQTTTLNQKM